MRFQRAAFELALTKARNSLFSRGPRHGGCTGYVVCTKHLNIYICVKVRIVVLRKLSIVSHFVCYDEDTETWTCGYAAWRHTKLWSVSLVICGRL